MAGNVLISIRNSLEGIQAENITVTDQDGLYPKEHLAGAYAVESWRPFRHEAPATANASVTIDLSQVTNGGGEAATMDGWTQNNVGASNVVTNVDTQFNSGARAFKLTVVTTGGSNKTEFYQDVAAKAGYRMNVTVALRGDGTRTVRARVIIPATGQYVTSGGSLTTTPTDFATRTLASWATTAPVSFTMPAYSQGVPYGEYAVRLLAYMDGSAAGEGFVDDFYLWPSTDVAAVLGHDITPAVTAFELRRDTAAFAGAGTLESGAFSTIYHPTMYHLPASIRDDRYWRFLATGTAFYPLWYGQLYLGQKQLLSEKPQYGLEWRYISDQIRNPTTGGAIRVNLLADIERRVWDVPWEFVSEATWEQVRDRLFRQTHFGWHPVLLIADQDDPESAGLAIIPEAVAAVNRSAQLRGSQFAFEEQPFPVFVDELPPEPGG